MPALFKRDSVGIGQVLRSDEVADVIHRLAVETADNVRGMEPEAEDVTVDDYVTDRAASSVTIRDARGRLWQVRDGLLSRAAGAAGLEVRAR